MPAGVPDMFLVEPRAPFQGGPVSSLIPSLYVAQSLGLGGRHVLTQRQKYHEAFTVLGTLQPCWRCPFVSYSLS